MSSTESTEEEMGTSPSVSGSCESSENVDMRDPYGILELGRRDIGPYNHFRVIEASSVNSNLVTSSSMLHRKLK